MTEKEREDYCKDCERSIYGNNSFKCDVNIENNGKYTSAGDTCHCKVVRRGDEDCISRQDLITTIYANSPMYKGEGTVLQILDDIDTLPSVQPIRAKGKWITRSHVYGAAYCSECNFELKINDTNYCPNCGAEMAESEDEE